MDTQHSRADRFASFFKRRLGLRLAERPKPQPPSPAKSQKSGKHARLRAEHRHLHMSSELRARATERRKLAPMDPQLARIVAERRCGDDGRPLPAKEQPKIWLKLRDDYAAANFDLAHRAAAKQWERNRHLEREWVPCVFHRGDRNERGKSLCRCRGRLEYRCQPDLERLAYEGLLEAIRRFDPEQAGCLSSYAVHKMKFSMLTLLRQTPVFYPQDLLRDRRDVSALRKRLAREPEEAEVVEELGKRGKCDAARARLAMNCYYGNERKSVEELHDKYFGRQPRDEKRLRRARLGTVVESLSVEQPRAEHSEDIDEVLAAAEQLSPEHREEVRRAVIGRGRALSQAALEAVRELVL